MTNQELKDLSNICESILMFQETGYSRGKKFIKQFFEKPLDKGQDEQVRRRLILIDALYSTNMNRRLYGIEELASEISQYSDKDCIGNFRGINATEKFEKHTIIGNSSL